MIYYSYIEVENGEAVSLLTGHIVFQKNTGFRCFIIDYLETKKNYIDLFLKVRRTWHEEINYVFYYRKKSNSLYFSAIFKDEHWKTKRVWKNGFLHFNALKQMIEERITYDTNHYSNP